MPKNEKLSAPSARKVPERLDPTAPLPPPSSSMRLLLLCTVLLAAATPLPAQDAPHDPLLLSPGQNRLLLENHRVRVFETQLGTGEATPPHSHPDFVVHLLSDAQLRITSSTNEPRNVEAPLGTTLWQPAQTHAIENLGLEPVRILHVELKQAPGATAEKPVIFQPGEIVWKPAPEPLPKGVEWAVLAGDPAEAGPFIVRVRFPARSSIPPHRHPADEHATVLSGKLNIGLGDVFDRARTTAVEPGGYSLVPAGQAHFSWFAEETELQIHGQGPWETVYLEAPAPPK